MFPDLTAADILLMATDFGAEVSPIILVVVGLGVTLLLADRVIGWFKS